MEGDDANPETDGFAIRFKRRNLKGKRKICPKCLSDLHLAGELTGWLLPEEYICESCGYRGHVAFEPLSVDSRSKAEPD